MEYEFCCEDSHDYWELHVLVLEDGDWYLDDRFVISYCPWCGMKLPSKLKELKK